MAGLLNDLWILTVEHPTTMCTIYAVLILICTATTMLIVRRM